MRGAPASTVASDTYHEPYELIAENVRDLHRAIVSLMEELEAIDWYSQRASACGDKELAGVLLHNRDEEVEHAMMVLEWIRRRDPVFDRYAREYLFTERPLLELEESGEPDDSHDGLGVGTLREESP